MSVMKVVKAAFSKSVSWISILLNSVRHPMCGSFGPVRGGGGFHRTLCLLKELDIYCEKNNHDTRWQTTQVVTELATHQLVL